MAFSPKYQDWEDKPWLEDYFLLFDSGFGIAIFSLFLTVLRFQLTVSKANLFELLGVGRGLYLSNKGILMPFWPIFFIGWLYE